MQKIAWFITIIVVAAASFLVWGVQNGKLFVEKNSLPLSVISVQEADNFYNIRAEYPQFKNVNPSFNKEISDLITGRIDIFKEEVKDNWEARRATASPENPVPESPEQPFDFIASWDPNQFNGNYISFVVRLYYYTGGAHGNNEIHTFNYDVKEEKKITIMDFLSSDQKSLENLAVLSAQDITSQLEADGFTVEGFMEQMIEDGTKPTEENYKNFNFNYNSLTIYFQQYQVAPGVVGPMTATFYKNTLNENSISSGYLK